MTGGSFIVRPRHSDALPGDYLGQLLHVIGTAYGAERLLERTHSLFAEDPTVVADLRHELEVVTDQRARMLTALEFANERVRRLEGETDTRCGHHPVDPGDPTTCDRQADHGGPHHHDSTSTSWVVSREDRAGTRRKCGSRTLTGDIACALEPGHLGLHRGGTPQIAWSDGLHASIVCGHELRVAPVAPGNPDNPWTPILTCELPDGHATRHCGPVTW